METGVVDHIAEPGTSALDRACTLAGEMQGCGKSERTGSVDTTCI